MIKKKLNKKNSTKAAPKAEYKPKPERVIPKYKRNERWVMLVEYRKDITNRRLQKLMFKTEKGGILTATKEAERTARMLSKAMSVSLKEMEEVTLCRVVAVYAEDVFESWQKEVGVDLSKTHISKAVKLAQSMDKEIGKVKKIGVR